MVIKVFSKIALLARVEDIEGRKSKEGREDRKALIFSRYVRKGVQGSLASRKGGQYTRVGGREGRGSRLNWSRP